MMTEDPVFFSTLTFSWGSSGGAGGGGAGYRSRVTGGAGGVSLRAAGEQHTHIAGRSSSIVPRRTVSY